MAISMPGRRKDDILVVAHGVFKEFPSVPSITRSFDRTFILAHKASQGGPLEYVAKSDQLLFRHYLSHPAQLVVGPPRSHWTARAPIVPTADKITPPAPPPRHQSESGCESDSDTDCIIVDVPAPPAPPAMPRNVATPAARARAVALAAVPHRAPVVGPSRVPAQPAQHISARSRSPDSSDDEEAASARRSVREATVADHLSNDWAKQVAADLARAKKVLGDLETKITAGPPVERPVPTTPNAIASGSRSTLSTQSATAPLAQRAEPPAYNARSYREPVETAIRTKKTKESVIVTVGSTTSILHGHSGRNNKMRYLFDSGVKGYLAVSSLGDVIKFSKTKRGIATPIHADSSAKDSVDSCDCASDGTLVLGYLGAQPKTQLGIYHSLDAKPELQHFSPTNTAAFPHGTGGVSAVAAISSNRALTAGVDKWCVASSSAFR